MTPPTRHPHPNACPGSYTLDLYCAWENEEHGFREFPQQPSNCQTYSQAAKQARSWGWKLYDDGLATCPKCVKALRAAGLPDRP